MLSQKLSADGTGEPSDPKTSSSAMETSDPGSTTPMYQLKTMCLAKKTVHLPNKEEHGFLLFCGLGARKWQISIEVNSLSFREAVLNIYPRLRSVDSYNLWTLSKDKKTFERLPEKVNTPKRIRSYLGSGFSGCLIVVPVTDILLMEEKRVHIRQQGIKGDGKESKSSSQTEIYEGSLPSRSVRSFCLICGKMEKAPGTGTFHKILDESITTGNGNITIAKKLKDILGIDLPKPKWVASDEICKKCLRTVCDVVNLEDQLRRDKEELVSNFFSTTSKIHKSHSHMVPDNEAGVSPPRTDKTPGPAPPFPRLPLPSAFPQPILLSPHVSSHQPAIAFFNQQPGLVSFYHQPYRRQPESDCETADPKYKYSSEYAGSEVSSFMSVSPKLRQDYGESEQHETESARSITPRPFDNRSYASTFSFKSYQSSVRSKAEYKSYEPHFSESEPGSGQDTYSKDRDSYTKVREDEQETPENLSCGSAGSAASPSSSNSPPSASPLSEVTSKETSPKKPWKKRRLEIQIEEINEEPGTKEIRKDDQGRVTIDEQKEKDTKCSEQTDPEK